MAELSEAQKEVARMHAGISSNEPGHRIGGYMVTRAPEGGFNYRGDRIRVLGETVYRNGVETGKISDLKPKK